MHWLQRASIPQDWPKPNPSPHSAVTVSISSVVNATTHFDPTKRTSSCADNAGRRTVLPRHSNAGFLPQTSPDTALLPQMIMPHHPIATSTSLPITTPDKRPTPPLCTCLLLSTRPNRPRTHVELPSTINPRFLRREDDARLSVFAAGRGLLREQLCPRLS